MKSSSSAQSRLLPHRMCLLYEVQVMYIKQRYGSLHVHFTRWQLIIQFVNEQAAWCVSDSACTMTSAVPTGLACIFNPSFSQLRDSGIFCFFAGYHRQSAAPLVWWQCLWRLLLVTRSCRLQSRCCASPTPGKSPRLHRYAYVVIYFCFCCCRRCSLSGCS